MSGRRTYVCQWSESKRPLQKTGGRRHSEGEGEKEGPLLICCLKCFPQGKITITFNRIEPPKGKGMDICKLMSALATYIHTYIHVLCIHSNEEGETSVGGEAE